MSKDTLLAIGEALIDFIPSRSGCTFDEVESFSPSVGGAPANVCGAFSRLGGRSRLITQLGDDPFGRKIEKELAGDGIDTSCISFTPKANTALAFVSLGQYGERTFSFYRKPSADMLFSPEQLRPEWFADAYALHFCSVALGGLPMRAAHKRAVSYARDAGAIVSFDPNLRFQLWDDREALRRVVLEFLPCADILKLSDEETEFITGEKDLRDAVETLFEGNVKLVIVTCGKDGAYAFTGENEVYSLPQGGLAMDSTGAGDGFIGSFLWKLHDDGVTADELDRLDSDRLGELLEFSNRFCGISVQQHGAIASYPTLSQMGDASGGPDQ